MNRESYLQVTVALTTDCPTIMVHAGKLYKALIDSGAAISLIRYSTYQTTDNSFKMPIQATTTKLNTADGSPRTELGMMALQLRIADFKFAHNFIICLILPTWKYYLALISRRNFPCHMPGIRKNPLHTERGYISHLY